MDLTPAIVFAVNYMRRHWMAFSVIFVLCIFVVATNSFKATIVVVDVTCITFGILCFIAYKYNIGRQDVLIGALIKKAQQTGQNADETLRRAMVASFSMSFVVIPLWYSFTLW